MGKLMVILVPVFIGSALITGLLFAGTRWMDRQQGPRLDGVGHAIAADLCAPTPTTVDGRQIQLYRGIRVSHPVDGAGTFGTARSPSGRPVGGKFVELDDGTLLVMTTSLAEAYGEVADDTGWPVGDPVSFCATVGDDAFWWPRTGHRSGLFGGPVYGEPVGPWPTARRIPDLDPQPEG